jgi:succinyl-CoA synthetase beta subunit
VWPCRGAPLVFRVDEAVAAAKGLGGSVWVVKAQIHAGGRGKGGGVKVAKSLDDVKTYASPTFWACSWSPIKPARMARRCVACLFEEGADIQKELYVAVVTDRVTQKVCVMGSSEGGMDIEEVAA